MHKIGVIVSLTLLSVPAAWGATNNCGATPSGTGYDNPTAPVTLTAAGAENGAGLGCTTVDNTFNNFSVASTGITTTQTTTLTDGLATVTGGTSPAPPTQVEVALNPTATTAWKSAGFSQDSLTETIEFTDVVSGGFDIDGASLNLTGIAGFANAGSTLDVNAYVCMGTTEPCKGSGEVLTTLTFDQTDIGATTTSITGTEQTFTGNTTIEIELVVSIANTADAFATLGGADLLLDETAPEPATFYLVVPLLFGMLFLSYRRLKKA